MGESQSSALPGRPPPPVQPSGYNQKQRSTHLENRATSPSRSSPRGSDFAAMVNCSYAGCASYIPSAVPLSHLFVAVQFYAAAVGAVEPAATPIDRIATTTQRMSTDAQRHHRQTAAMRDGPYVCGHRGVETLKLFLSPGLHRVRQRVARGKRFLERLVQ